MYEKIGTKKAENIEVFEQNLSLEERSDEKLMALNDRESRSGKLHIARHVNCETPKEIHDAAGREAEGKRQVKRKWLGSCKRALLVQNS